MIYLCFPNLSNNVDFEHPTCKGIIYMAKATPWTEYKLPCVFFTIRSFSSSGKFLTPPSSRPPLLLSPPPHFQNNSHIFPLNSHIFLPNSHIFSPNSLLLFPTSYFLPKLRGEKRKGKSGFYGNVVKFSVLS